MRRRLVVLLCAGLALAACSDSGSGSKVSAGATTSAAGAATTAPSAATGLEGASTSPTSTPSQGQPQALLTDVRAAAQTGFDRIVFQFDAATPGYSVGYETMPFTNGDSGATIPLSGDAHVAIKLTDASSVNMSGPSPTQTYTGPKRFTPSGTAVAAEVVLLQDSEGTLSFGVGLKRQVPFKVSTLTEPNRVVVDFAD